MKNIPINNHSAQGEVPTSGPSVTSFFAESEAELMYVEQYVPASGDALHIYWSGCNFFFGARGGYAGIQHQNDNVIDGAVFTYNNICSIWDLGTPDEPEVNLEYGIEGLHSSHFGGEGTGLHTSHPMPWHLDQWYGLVIRRWFVPGEEVTHMAMFMYSYTDEKWTHYMSAAIPGGDIPLSGTTCNGFLERFNGNALGYHGYYGQHFRMSKDGTWHKPVYYEASAGGDPHTWDARLVGDDTNIMLVAGGRYDNEETSIRLEPNQFDDKPKVVRTPVISLVHCTYNSNNGTLHVEWFLDPDTPPQLSYRIDVRAGASGPLVARNSNTLPHQRETSFQTGMLAPGVYIATLIITDIFNQQSTPYAHLFST